MTPSPSLLLLLLHALDNWLEHRKQTCKPTNLGFWSILQLPFNAFLDRQQAYEKQTQPAPLGWIDIATRRPTREDGSARIGNVLWLCCDGFVCEPYVAPWNHTATPSCTLVAWMPIPIHSKYYNYPSA